MATRSFEFVYGAVIDELEPGQTARVWIPVAKSDALQDVGIVSVSVPGEHRLTTEPRYGNRMLYFEADAGPQGEIPLSVTYRVARKEATPENGAATTPDESLFLAPSTNVPVGGRPLESLLAGRPLEGAAMDIAADLYERVDDHLTYDKPPGGAWGRGDAEWACESGFGNCTDFHSLFISLSRASNVPAMFEIGFPIGPEPEGTVGGYHCWAWFAADARWVPVDISEADKLPERKAYYFGHLTPDRVAFTVGRDLLLEPAQNGPLVNFLVYPYVEVDGQPHTSFRPDFRYRDVR